MLKKEFSFDDKQVSEILALSSYLLILYCCFGLSESSEQRRIEDVLECCFHSFKDLLNAMLSGTECLRRRRVHSEALDSVSLKIRVKGP